MTDEKPHVNAISVLTNHSSEWCHEKPDDTVIAHLPKNVSLYVDGKLDPLRLKVYLEQVMKKCSDAVKEHAHHAEFIVTRLPGMIDAWIDSHCPTCNAGADQAKAWMKDNPGKELLVGRLWWVIPQPKGKKP